MQTYLIFNNPLSLDSNSALIIEQQYQSDINKHSVHLKLTTTGRQSVCIYELGCCFTQGALGTKLYLFVPHLLFITFPHKFIINLITGWK